MIGFLILYVLYFIEVVTIAIREVRHPIRALTWISICTVFPVFGLFFYFSISRPLCFRRSKIHSVTDHIMEERLMGLDSTSRSIAKTLNHATRAVMKSGRVRVLADGEEKFQLLMKCLESARSSIDMEYYIFRDDHIGSTVVHSLIKRSNAGVRVRLLIDGFGSRKFPLRELNRMAEAGVECRIFFPVKFPWIRKTLNHRDHSKIVVIDGEQAFVGGMNIGDEYASEKSSIGHWRDTHLFVEGDCVRSLAELFTINWNIGTIHHCKEENDFNREKEINGHGNPLLSIAKPNASYEFGSDLVNIDVHTADTDVSLHARDTLCEEALVQMVESGPDRFTQNIRYMFFVCLTEARKSIEITTPYFVPEADVTMAMKAAVMRGVTVRLLVPKKSDHKMVGLASETYYGELLDAGVQIYQYDAGVLHAKVITVDGCISVVGAANCDLRSFRLNYEVCEVIYSVEVAQQLIKQFTYDLQSATLLSKAELEQYSMMKRFCQRGARILAPLL